MGGLIGGGAVMLYDHLNGASLSSAETIVQSSSSSQNSAESTSNNEPTSTRKEAQQEAKDHAQVRKKTGESIPMENTNPSSRGKNWEQQKANGAKKSGMLDPQKGNFWNEHPDGHPDMNSKHAPEHHKHGHFHAKNSKGKEKVIPYKPK